MTEIEQTQQFIRIVATMPPKVQKALLIVMEWKGGQSK
jgi:hypothetical protein